LISLFSYSLSFSDILIIGLVALLIGMAKTGINGAGMLAVPLLAAVFGGKMSSGLMLPILIMADVFGVRYYHRHASWQHLKILFPWAAGGVFLGTLIGGMIDDELFKTIMGIIIVFSVGIMIWMERGHKEDVPDYWWFGMLCGIAGGVTSMVGNLAGPVMALYLLSMRLPKNEFIGTAAWFFMVLNWFKVPFHLFIWKTISMNSLLLNISTLPLIALGAYLGVVIVRQIPEKAYRWFIIMMTIVAAGFMLF
jgi:uncharacterized membrane protein YfcA